MGDWDNVRALEGERYPLMRNLFVTPAPEAIRETFVGTIAFMLATNQAIYRLVEEAKYSTANDLRQFRQRKEATQAYSIES